mmetsp:Transcript_34255/g.98674  ORF Transcript_34255/g.98674 Transcript_34255/m.98674 type:complete len:202 (-) Transcript_34255:537-1142(-)
MYIHSTQARSVKTIHRQKRAHLSREALYKLAATRVSRSVHPSIHPSLSPGRATSATRRLVVQTSVLQPHHRRHTDHSPHLYNTHPLLSPPTHTQTPSHTRASCNTLPVWVGVHSTTHTHATKSYMVWYVPLVGKTPLSASWSGRSPKLTPVRSLSTQTATRPHESVSQSAAHEGHVGLVGQKRSARRKKRKPHHRCVVAPV